MEGKPPALDDGVSKLLKNLFYGTFTVFSIAGIAYIGYKIYDEQKNKQNGRKHRKKQRSEGKKKGDRSIDTNPSDEESNEEAEDRLPQKQVRDAQEGAPTQQIGHKKRPSTLEAEVK